MRNQRPARLRWNAIIAGVALVGAIGTTLATTTPAFASGGWQAPSHIDGTNGIWSMSCATPSFCVAIDNASPAQSFTYNGSTWSGPKTVESFAFQYIDSVSCPVANFCVAVDSGGYAYTFNGTSWSVPDLIDNGTGMGANLTSVSCVPGITTSCMAVSGVFDHYLTFNGSSWSAPATVETYNGSNSLVSVSCPSTSFCAAVDFSDNALTYSGGTWSPPTSLESGNNMSSISCTSSTFCMAGDTVGNSFAYDGTNWTLSSSSGGRWLSCLSTTFCLGAVNASVVVYNGTGWTSPYTDIAGITPLESVSCPTSGFCVAGDNNGDVFVGTPPFTTPPPTGFRITTTSVPNATPGAHYSDQLAATGGPAPYKWKRTAGALPKGLKVNSKGLLSGTPSLKKALPGSYSFTVRATTKKSKANPTVSTATQTLTLTVN